MTTTSKLGLFWRSTWSGIAAWMGYIFKPWLSVLDNSLPKLPESGAIGSIMVIFIAYIPSAILFLAAAATSIIGGLFGAIRGAFHAITRKPATQDDFNLTKNRLAIVLSKVQHGDTGLAQRLIERIVSDYSRNQTLFASSSSKRLIQALQDDRTCSEKINSIKKYMHYAFETGEPHGSRTLGFLKVALNKSGSENQHYAEFTHYNDGKKLFSTIVENLKLLCPAEGELRRNTALIALAKRDPGTCFFHVPSDVLKIIATETRDASLPEKEAKTIVQSSFNYFYKP